MPSTRSVIQRKRHELQGPRQGLIGLLVVTAVLAVTGGIAMIAGPDPLRRWLDPLAGWPFASARGTGVLLVILIGGAQATAATLLVRRHVRGRAAALAAALVAIAWSILQLMLLARPIGPVHAMLGIGALEVLLVAGCTPREIGGRKQRRGRR